MPATGTPPADEPLPYQLELLTITPVLHCAGQTLEQRFMAFHAANPHIFEALRTLALRMQRSGRRHYSIKGLFEVLRWSYALQTRESGVEFKLNNSYTAFYARLLNQDPALAGFFELRAQRWQRPTPGRRHR